MKYKVYLRFAYPIIDSILRYEANKHDVECRHPAKKKNKKKHKNK